MRLLIFSFILHTVFGGSLVTVEHYNQPNGITYESGYVPIGLRAGPHSVSTTAALKTAPQYYQQSAQSNTYNQYVNRPDSINDPSKQFKTSYQNPIYDQHYNHQTSPQTRDGHYYAHQQSSSHGPGVPVSSVSVRIPVQSFTSGTTSRKENYSNIRYNNQASLNEPTVSSPALSLHLLHGNNRAYTTPASIQREREPLSTVYPVYVQAPNDKEEVPKSFINSHYAAGGSSVTIQDTNQHHPIVSTAAKNVQFDAKKSFRTVSPVSARIIAPVQFSTKQVYTQAPGAAGLLPPYTSSSFEILPNSQPQAYTHDSYRNPLPVNQVTEKKNFFFKRSSIIFSFFLRLFTQLQIIILN